MKQLTRIRNALLFIVLALASCSPTGQYKYKIINHEGTFWCNDTTNLATAPNGNSELQIIGHMAGRNCGQCENELLVVNKPYKIYDLHPYRSIDHDALHPSRNDENKYPPVPIIVCVVITIAILASVPWKRLSTKFTSSKPNTMRKTIITVFFAIVAWEILMKIPQLLDIFITWLKR